MIGQPRLGPYPVFHRKHGKSGAPGLACGRVDAGRAGGTKARTDVIDADHEKTIGIHSFARAHHVVPPAERLEVVCGRSEERRVGKEEVSTCRSWELPDYKKKK